MNKLLKFLLAFGLIVSMISCSDDGDPVLSASVKGGEVNFARGEVITFEISATDDTGISEILITNAALNLTGSVKQFADPKNVNLEYTLSGTENAEINSYKIKFEAIDLEGNHDTKEVTIALSE